MLGSVLRSTARAGIRGLFRPVFSAQSRVAAGAAVQQRFTSSRPLLMIPGPIEYSDEVLKANAIYGVSHTDPHFIEAFGSTLGKLRDVFLAPDGQPVVMAGSGSLGWDMMVVNLLEPGDEVLVVSIGYFGDSFAQCARSYGFGVDFIEAEVGDVPSSSEITKALDSKKYKMVHVTHVDTSTAVRSDIQSIASLVRQKQGDALVVVDGVCALAGEEMRMKEWDIDGYITGSQKALGVPCGLSIQMLRPRALDALERRATATPSYYLSYANWLPIMRNYEQRKPSYFATPNVSTIYALEAGVDACLSNGGMEARFKEHKNTSEGFKRAITSLGLTQIAKKPEIAANTLSAIRYPEGVSAATLLPAVKAHGAIIGGGLHKACKDEYFRVGHMAMSSRTPAHIEQTVSAADMAAQIEQGLIDCGHKVEKGTALKALK